MANSYLDHNLALLAHLRGILIAMGESDRSRMKAISCFSNASTNSS